MNLTMAFDLKKLQHVISVDLMSEGEKIAAPLYFADVVVLPIWLDYNDHMNESIYMYVAGLGYEGFARYIGITPEWATKKGSYFTVESHNTYLSECHAGDKLSIKTQLVSADEKKAHLLHFVYRGKQLVFVNEQMKLYIGFQSRRVEKVTDEIQQRLQRIKETHQHLSKRYVGSNISNR